MNVASVGIANPPPLSLGYLACLSFFSLTARVGVKLNPREDLGSLAVWKDVCINLLHAFSNIINIYFEYFYSWFGRCRSRSSSVPRPFSPSLPRPLLFSIPHEHPDCVVAMMMHERRQGWILGRVCWLERCILCLRAQLPNKDSQQ